MPKNHWCKCWGTFMREHCPNCCREADHSHADEIDEVAR